MSMMERLRECKQVDDFASEDKGEDETFYITVEGDALENGRQMEFTGWPRRPLVLIDGQVYRCEEHRLIGTELILEMDNIEGAEHEQDVVPLGITSDRLVLKPVVVVPKGQTGEPALKVAAPTLPPSDRPHPAFADDPAGWQMLKSSQERVERILERHRLKQKRRTAVTAAATTTATTTTGTDRSRIYAPGLDGQTILASLAPSSQR